MIWDGDGRADETYVYAGRTLDAIEYDRNADGKIDARWVHDLKGVPKRYEGDDDFDGIFEWRGDAERGWVVRDVMDANRDGRPELISIPRWRLAHDRGLRRGKEPAW